MAERHGRGSLTGAHSPSPAGAATLEREHGRRWLLTLAFAASLFWIVDLVALGGGAPHPLDDSWEYGLAAKSLIAGHGFRTPMIHPPLWPLRDASFQVPVLIHGPLLPLLAAPLVSVSGDRAPDRIAWLAAAFAVLAAVFAARAAARAMGLGAGWLAGALTTASPLMIRAVHHDVAPAAGACVAAVALDLIARPAPRAFAAGLVLGLGALVRPEFSALALIAAFAVRGHALRLLAGVALPVVPWAWRAAVVTGRPGFNLSSYLLLADTRRYPELAALRDWTLTPSTWTHAFQGMGSDLVAKWVHHAPRAIAHALRAPSIGTGGIAAVGAAVSLADPKHRRNAVLALAAAAVPMALTALTESSERYVTALLPLWAIGTIAGLEWLRGTLPGRGAAPRAWSIGFLLLLPSTLGTLAYESRDSRTLARWLADERSRLAPLAANGERGRLLFSDTPDFAAWTTGRPAVWVTRDEYLRLPPPGTSAPDRPSRGAPTDTWFHADAHAIPAPGSHGLRVEETEASVGP